MTKGARIRSDKIDIDNGAVSRFFDDRAKRYDESRPLVSVIYQDSNPELAVARDQHEKRVVLPLLQISETDSVLDVGCGIGRWADALRGKVSRYHGTDFSPGLVDIAKKRFEDEPSFTFQALEAQHNTPERLDVPPPFDLVIVAGLFLYLNDENCGAVLSNIERCCADDARIFIREPVGIDERLTLKGIWSDELKSEYSAIYRTVGEYEQAMGNTLGAAGFQFEKNEPLFPPELVNRKETTQHIFLLRRS